MPLREQEIRRAVNDAYDEIMAVIGGDSFPVDLSAQILNSDPKKSSEDWERVLQMAIQQGQQSVDKDPRRIGLESVSAAFKLTGGRKRLVEERLRSRGFFDDE